MKELFKFIKINIRKFILLIVILIMLIITYNTVNNSCETKGVVLESKEANIILLPYENNDDSNNFNSDIIEYSNELEEVRVTGGTVFNVTSKKELGYISLYIFKNGSPIIQKGYHDELSFVPPNEKGTYLYLLKCNNNNKKESTYVFKLEVTSLLNISQDVQDIIDEFKSDGFNPTYRKITLDYFLVPPIMIELGNDDNLKVLEFDTSKEARKQMDLIHDGGHTIDGICISWISAPHFYNKDNIIVFYVGKNRSILSILDKMFNKFAG